MLLPTRMTFFLLERLVLSILLMMMIFFIVLRWAFTISANDGLIFSISESTSSLVVNKVKSLGVVTSCLPTLLSTILILGL